MAGLAGMVALAGAEPGEWSSLVERMCRQQAHRGPDDQGLAAVGPVVFGAARLRVHDLSPAGRQPMADAADEVWLAFDGEIYNFKELQRELEALGDTFRTGTDTEVVLHAYRAWGEASFDRFRGMFTLIIHDRRSRTTLLVRDHFGMKPLQYVIADRALYFASELRPLLAARPGIGLNRRALLEWTLYGDVMPPETLFEGVMSVPPGHLLEIPHGATEPRCRAYYRLHDHVDPSRYQKLAKTSPGDLLQELDEVLQQSVTECLAGEVPAGVMLSGGIDSAIITAIAARHKDITAFHLSVPDDPRLDERIMAEEVAAKAGVPIIVVPATGEAFRRELANVTRINEMPVWHMQLVGFHLLAQRAKQEGIKILLTGDSIGNRLGVQAGRHAAWKWLTPVRNSLQRLPDRYQNAVTKAVWATKGMPVGSAGFVANFSLVMHLIDGFGRAELLRECQEAYHFIGDPAARAIMATKLADITEWRQRFFHRGDRLGMAASLECRDPLSDVSSVNYTINLPLEFILRRGVAKWALKEVSTRYLPRSIAFQKKVAWDLPADQYLAPFARLDLFKDGFCAEVFRLDVRSMARLVDNWRADLATFFNLLQVEIWGRLWLLGESPDQITDRAERMAA